MDRAFDRALLCLCLVVTAAACDDQRVAIGQPCDLDTENGPPPGSNLVAYPHPDCPSSYCMYVLLTEQDMCTGHCASDADCVAARDTPCSSGFTCTIVVDVGPLCCQPMCVCNDYLSGDAGPWWSFACDASNPQHECCNLPGRGCEP